MRKRQKKRGKCIKACASNFLAGKNAQPCNCSGKVLRLGHCQPGDRVTAFYRRGEREQELDVIYTSDIGWKSEDNDSGRIPLTGASVMVRLLHSTGPTLTLPAMTTCRLKTKHSTVPRAHALTDPLGGK